MAKREWSTPSLFAESHAPMKFNFFHSMPWPHYEGVPESWPVASNGFDGERGHALYEDYIATMVYAEACEFDWIACNEHHYSPFSLMPNCNLIASIIAHKTQKAKISVLGNLIPLLNPVRVAEEYAMLDVLSGGRFIAGLMRGIPHEYLAYNIAPGESHARMREATELIIKCWTEPEPFGWEGEYYQFPSIAIWPKPYQKPHPPLVMSATNPEAAELAARFKAIIGMVFLQDLDWGRNIAENYRKAARAHGWEATPEHLIVGEHTVIAESDDEALAIMKRGHDYLHRVLMRPQRDAQRIVIEKTRFFGHNTETGQQFQQKLALIKTRTVEESIEKGSILCGNPATVVKQMKRIHQATGNGIFSLNFKVGDVPEPTLRRGMELFRDHVLPEMRDV
jgi:alkanesulfonate monooxygenase SsuD/methylene tetrahydromethanopterin reductase-like flavin-dependent oxidoreductase (luciferase family)